jgi:hypothetical protein
MSLHDFQSFSKRDYEDDLNNKDVEIKATDVGNAKKNGSGKTALDLSSNDSILKIKKKKKKTRGVV